MSNSHKSHTNEVLEITRMIICAIDSLKGRKARPDEQKICNFVERRFGLRKEDIISGIKEAVTKGSVLKVKYKDFISYRNPKNFSSKMSNHIMSLTSNSCITPQNMKHILRELRSLSRTNSDGVPKPAIIESLNKHCHSVDYSESLVDKVLIRAIQTGSVQQLSNGNYMLCVGKRIVPRKRDVDQTASSVEFFDIQRFGSESDVDNKNNNKDKDNGLDNDVSDLNEDSTQSNSTSTGSAAIAPSKNSLEVRRERPVSKRKKFKKSLGPDFIESSELGSHYMRNSFEPKCDLCQLRSKSDKRGQKEELLSCKDCNTKAHPSCMDYSEELAERSGRSPWQCMECKTCDICHDSKDGANMLVCDLCDKGYHMNCHIPTLTYKPIGKWECSHCSANRDCLKVDTNLNNSECDQQNKSIDNSSADLMSDPIERLSVKRNSESSSLSSFALNSKENDVNSCPEVVPNPQKWSAEDVENYIRNIGFPEQSILFKEQEIDGTSLLLLRRSDVLTGFQMKLGPALKIYSHIVRLQKND